MNDPICIDDAKPRHARDIQEVFYKTWMDTYVRPEHGISRDDIEDHLKDAFSAETIRNREEKIANLPASQKYLVALEQNRVIGLIRATKEPNSNKINVFYVLPDYQSRGIGNALWMEMEKFLDATKDTSVNVFEFNENAKRFYEKRGFVDTGERFTRDRFRFKSGTLMPELSMVRKALP